MVIQWIYNRLANSQFLYDLFCDFVDDMIPNDPGFVNAVNKENDGIPDRRKRNPRQQRRPRQRRRPRTQRGN